MLNKFMLAGASVLTLAAAVSTANASTLVNFDDLAAVIDFSGSSVTDNGFVFTDTGMGDDYIWTGDSPNSNGTNNLIAGNGNYAAVTITKVGGGAFTLSSFDTSISWYSTNTVDSIDVDGVPLIITNTPTTYDVNLTGTSVTINGLNSDSGYFQADNFVFNAAAVPEPATWAMMLAGLGMVGFAMRKRASVRVNYAQA